MFAEGKTQGSPTTGLADQTIVTQRFTKHNALGAADVAARYYEYAIRGKLWVAKTADAGVAPGTSVGTTAAFALYNAKGSGVNVVLIGVGIGYVSGTLGAGFVELCTNVNLSEAVPTGTAITARPGLVGGASPAGGVALTTATLATTPNGVLALWNLGAALATTTQFPLLGYQEIAGMVVLPPGGSMSLQGVAAAGTSPLVVFSCIFAEEPI